MDVRTATPDDTEAICRIGTAAWHAAYVDILDAETVEERTDEWYSHERVRGYFDEDDLPIYVAGNPVAGFAFCKPDDAGEELHLTSLYVHPDRWGEGIGSALLERVEREARERGLDTVALVVFDENDVGRGFYESHGYEERRVREESLDDRVEELEYAKRLR